MRIVLDTNVLISSLWGGHPKRAVDACRQGRAKLLVSRPILEEYIAVLSRFDISDEDSDLFEALFTDPRRTEIYSPTSRVHVVSEDDSDNKYLECARSGRADFIVSGDRHLLRLEAFRGIPIVTPKRFLMEI